MTLLNVDGKVVPLDSRKRPWGLEVGKLCACLLSPPTLYILYSKLSYMMRRLYPAKDAEIGNQGHAHRLCLSPFSYSG